MQMILPIRAVRRFGVGCAVALAFLVGADLSLAHAQDDDPFGGAASPLKTGKSRKNPTDDRIDFTMSVSPKEVRRGETVRVTIQGTLKPEFHTYPLTMRSADRAQDVSQLSKLTFEETKGVRALWPVEETEPEFETVEGVGVFLEHKTPFTWSQDVLVLPDATPGTKTLRYKVQLQVCDKTCVIGEHDLKTDVKVADAPAVALTPKLQERIKAKQPAIQVVPPPLDAKGKEEAPAITAAPIVSAPDARQGIGALLVASMGAAIAMLLTPCVFPMIPITVSFFLKQSERKNHNALLTAGVYSVTIIVVLAAAVLVLGGLIVRLANDAWLNLGLGAVLVFFALSLFGMYEIELPSSLSRFTSAREGQGGYLGAMFMALTFTITSFTCTGPFLGPLLVAVKEFQYTTGERLLGALCYAATFAAPFFVLALFPSLIKKLPKSGGWLNAIKVVMGFLELAAALKFLANSDLALNPGNALLFNYETVLCAWIALAIACGLYLLGLFRLPHDSPVESLGVPRMLLASAFFGLALYMIPALWRVTPEGVIGRGLVAFLPLDTREVPGATTAATREVSWHRDYEAAWRLATKEGKLIFIDFTGQNCTNCRYNEKVVFPKPRVHKELEKYVCVQLYTDFVPDSMLSPRASLAQAQRNSGWQSETFDDLTNPLYAVLRPDPMNPFVDGSGGKQKLGGMVLGVRKGLISNSDIGDFEKFLSVPQQQTATTLGQTTAAGVAFSR